MGNCSLKGTTTGECHHSIRVLSDSGAILQFKSPKTVGQVLHHYPGYGIFLRGHASSPLPVHESLSYGLFYYLLPLKGMQVDDEKASCSSSSGVSEQVQQVKGVLQRSEVEWNSTENDDEKTKKLMSLAGASDYVKNLSNGSALEVLPSAKNGVWKVKLVIETRQLEEILSQQVNIEALIEKMRMAATASPTRSRTMSTWKVGWKPTLFSTFWSPVNSGKITKRTALESNLSCYCKWNVSRW